MYLFILPIHSKDPLTRNKIQTSRQLFVKKCAIYTNTERKFKFFENLEEFLVFLKEKLGRSDQPGSSSSQRVTRSQSSKVSKVTIVGQGVKEFVWQMRGSDGVEKCMLECNWFDVDIGW